MFGWLPRHQFELQAVMTNDRERSLSLDGDSLGKSLVIVPAGAAHSDPDCYSMDSKEHPPELL